MKKIIIAAAVLAVFFTGCAMPFRQKLDSYLSTQKYMEADQLIEKEQKEGSEYKDKNELLYYFDRGSVSQMLGEYGLSNDYLAKADGMIEKLYTRNVADEAYSFLSNDMNLMYTGEDFEQVMVNILRSLNFMYEGNFKDARIEAKKVNNKLNWFADTYGDKAVYTDDAFARYLSAFSYEANGDINDAYIDYKKSLQVYERYGPAYKMEIPGYLKKDLLRTATALRFKNDVDEYKKKFGDIKFAKDADLKSNAEVLVVVYDGLSAYKEAGFNNFPKYVLREYAVQSISVTAQAAKSEAEFYDAQDVARMAHTSLEARAAQIMTKRMASTLLKEAAKRVPLVGLFVQDDKADTRSWRTLPSRFLVTRMTLSPGKSKVKVIIYPRGYDEDKTGTIAVVEKEIEIKLKAGEKKVIPIFFQI